MVQNADVLAVRNNHVRTGARRDLRSRQLCRHTSGSHIASGRTFRHTVDLGIHLLHDLNQLRVRVLVRIVGKQTVDIGKQDQKIRSYK